MTRNTRHLFPFATSAAAAALAALLTACNPALPGPAGSGGTTTLPAAAVAVQGISLDTTSATLNSGGGSWSQWTDTLTDLTTGAVTDSWMSDGLKDLNIAVSFSPANATNTAITWSISNPRAVVQTKYTGSAANTYRFITRCGYSGQPISETVTLTTTSANGKTATCTFKLFDLHALAMRVVSDFKLGESNANTQLSAENCTGSDSSTNSSTPHKQLSATKTLGYYNWNAHDSSGTKLGGVYINDYTLFFTTYTGQSGNIYTTAAGTVETKISNEFWSESYYNYVKTYCNGYLTPSNTLPLRSVTAINYSAAGGSGKIMFCFDGMTLASGPTVTFYLYGGTGNFTKY